MIHVVHKTDAASKNPTRRCGTSDNWESAWRDVIWRKHMEELNQPHNITIRGMESVHRYLETLVVCDKKFLEYHRNTDYEGYVLTIMNMVCRYILNYRL